MEDAYALYARRILRLAPLDALDADPGALDRGIIIHRALERFVAEWPDALPDDALQHLLHAGVQQFAELAHRPQVHALWWPRFVQVARWVVAKERARRPGLVALRAEVSGELELERPGGRFTVRARADRLEHHAGRQRHGGRLQDRASRPLLPRSPRAWRRSCRSRR